MIGKGRLGSNLSYWLKRGGAKEIYSFPAELNEFFQLSGQKLQSYINRAQIIFIASSEKKFKTIVTYLKNFDLHGKIVVHLANALTSLELKPLKVNGALIASFSPLQTFPFLDCQSSPFRNCYFLFEGDQKAYKHLQKVCQLLQSKLFPVSADIKPLLHLTAVITSNHLIALLKFAENQLNKNPAPGIDLQLFWPLIERTLKNVRRYGTSSAITGPAARGETQIIANHLSLLNEWEKELYKNLSSLLKTQST